MNIVLLQRALWIAIYLAIGCATIVKDVRRDDPAPVYRDAKTGQQISYSEPFRVWLKRQIFREGAILTGKVMFWPLRALFKGLRWLARRVRDQIQELLNN